MAQLSDKFEEYLSGLSDDEWNDLSTRVRAPKPQPPASGGVRQPPVSGAKARAGQAEARRRYPSGNDKSQSYAGKVY